MPQIFVHIAAYRDPETPHTLNDLLRKASRPEKISVGLIQQVMPGDATVPPSSRVRSIQVDARDSQGTCWARSLGYTLYRPRPNTSVTSRHLAAQAWRNKGAKQKNQNISVLNAS